MSRLSLGGRSWPRRSALRLVIPSLVLATLAVVAFLPIGVTRAAEPNSQVHGTAASSPKHASMLLNFKCGNPADVERMTRDTGLLLSLASSVNDFECRLSNQFLNSTRPAKLAVDGPFKDVMLGVPVGGDAHVDGLLKIHTVPHAERAALSITLEGTVALQSTGHSQGMQIKSEAVTQFKASKALFLNADGWVAEPAVCKADSTLKTNSVTSMQPKIFKRFAERIATQRVMESQSEAQAECTAHVAAAIRRSLDHEIEALTTAANTALKTHLAAASEAERARWHQIRFRSDNDYVHVARRVESNTVLVGWKPEDDKPLPAIVVRLSRANLDITRLLAQLPVLNTALVATPSSDDSTPARGALPPLKPSLNWQTDALTIWLDFEPAARLALEPTIGAGQ